MKPGSKLPLLGGLALVFLMAGLTYTYSQLNAAGERLSAAEDRLRQLDHAAKPAEKGGPAPAIDPKTLATADEVQALRTEIGDLRRALAAISAPPAGAKETVPPASKSDVAAAGDALADLSQEKLAALKKLVGDVIDEREKNQRSRWAGMTEDFTKQRRQQALDELEQRLQLSAYQKDQVGKVLEEQSAAAVQMISSAWTGGAGGPGRREAGMQQWTELEATTDTKVKQLLTAQQSVQYDAWKQETGGFRGFGPGGRRPPGGANPGGGMTGGPSGTSGGSAAGGS